FVHMTLDRTAKDLKTVDLLLQIDMRYAGGAILVLSNAFEIGKFALRESEHGRIFSDKITDITEWSAALLFRQISAFSKDMRHAARWRIEENISARLFLQSLSSFSLGTVDRHRP